MYLLKGGYLYRSSHHVHQDLIFESLNTGRLEIRNRDTKIPDGPQSSVNKVCSRHPTLEEWTQTGAIPGCGLITGGQQKNGGAGEDVQGTSRGTERSV